MTRRSKGLQCKHVPAEPILRLIATGDCPREGGKWKSDWTHWSGFENSLDPAFPQWVRELPQDSIYSGKGQHDRLVVAKLRRLKKRGLIEGCDSYLCGCRGEWRITEHGKEYLDTLAATSENEEG